MEDPDVSVTSLRWATPADFESLRPEIEAMYRNRTRPEIMKFMESRGFRTT